MYKEIEKIDFHPFKVSACTKQKHTLGQGYKNSYCLKYQFVWNKNTPHVKDIRTVIV